MVIIAIAAVKGAAVVYKKVKQEEARQATIAPLLSDDNFSNPSSSSASLPPRSDSFAGCRASNFDGATTVRFADEARAACRALADDDEREREAEEREKETEEREKETEEREKETEERESKVEESQRRDDERERKGDEGARSEKSEKTNAKAGGKTGGDGSLRRRATTGTTLDDGSFNSFTTTASARQRKTPSSDSAALSRCTASLDGMWPLARKPACTDDAAARPSKAAGGAGVARKARSDAFARTPKPAGNDGSFNSARREARRASADTGEGVGAKAGRRPDVSGASVVGAWACAEDGSFNSHRRARSSMPALAVAGDERGARPPPRAPGRSSRAVLEGSFNAAMGMK